MVVHEKRGETGIRTADLQHHNPMLRPLDHDAPLICRKKFVISTSTLNDGDFKKNLKMEVFDFDDVGKNDVIGNLEFNTAQLQVTE